MACVGKCSPEELCHQLGEETAAPGGGGRRKSQVSKDPSFLLRLLNLHTVRNYNANIMCACLANNRLVHVAINKYIYIWVLMSHANFITLCGYSNFSLRSHVLNIHHSMYNSIVIYAVFDLWHDMRTRARWRF